MIIIGVKKNRGRENFGEVCPKEEMERWIDESSSSAYWRDLDLG